MNLVIKRTLSTYQVTNLIDLHEWNPDFKGIHWNINTLRQYMYSICIEHFQDAQSKGM